MPLEIVEKSFNNTQIELLIGASDLCIDPMFGIQSLKTYLHQINLLKSGVSFSDLGFSDQKELSRTVTFYNNGKIVEGATKGSIAKVSLSGVMMMEDGLCSIGIKSLSEILTQLDRSPDVDGILLEVSSGGGEMLAGQLLNSTIKDLSKPIVAWGHYSGSAAVYATLNSTEIIASGENSSFGSIGALFSMNKKFVEQYKEEIEDIYSSQSPNKNKAFREYLNGDSSMMIEEATKADEIFMAAVRKARPLKGSIKETLSGGMFKAKDAKNRGLIDSIGTQKYAMKRLQVYINRNK